MVHVQAGNYVLIFNTVNSVKLENAGSGADFILQCTVIMSSKLLVPKENSATH